MKCLIILSLILLSKISLSIENIDINKPQKFESVDMENNTLVLSGKVYKYQMRDLKDSFITSDLKYKKLDVLKKGEYVYIKIRYTDDKSKLITYVGKIKDGS